MGKRGDKQVLFLCTGNYYRSRFAEVLFNAVAARMGLAWRASSRGLALERGFGNIGPIAAAAVDALHTLGVHSPEDLARFPVQATEEDFHAAAWVVALKQAEHAPLLQERFPAWVEKVEYWQVDDADDALALIEREVMDLSARLIGGGRPRADRPAGLDPLPPCARCGQPPATCTCAAREATPTKAAVVRVGRETKGRRGKGVTTVSDLPLDEAELLALAAQLKQACGTGGTVKEGRIEIQGDHRERLVAELESLGYRVKRAGG